jgi:hypothetical protein
MAALSVEEVLAAEADALHGMNWRTAARSAHPPRGQDAQEARTRLNADQRDGADLPPDEVERRKAFYRSLNKLKHAALCCSGGGIRSATFCLGVIQAFAKYDATNSAPRPPNPNNVPTGSNPEAPRAVPSAGTSTAGAPQRRETMPENSLLGRFHYLSTVSGGGYVGSWLSSWRIRDDFKTIIRNLTGRPDGADVEPPEISWLRAYSNYLTPRVGLASADSWAAVAIFIRNLMLNWLVIIPVVCLAILALKIIATVSVGIAHENYAHWPIILTLIIGISCLLVAQAFTTRHRPTRRALDGNVTQPTLLRRDLLWAVLSAIGVTIFFSSQYVSSFFGAKCPAPTVVEGVGLSVKIVFPAFTALAGLVIYSAGWIAGWPATRDARDYSRWAGSGLVYGGLVGVGAYLYLLLGPYSNDCAPSSNLWHLLLPIIFGVPWVLTAQMAADNIFVGLVSYEDNSDSDREWLGRAAGWLMVTAIAWALTAFLVFEGGDFLLSAASWIKKLVVTSGGVAGIVTALLGKSPRTPAKSISGKQSDATAVAFNIGLAIAGPIFVAVLVMGLSATLDIFLLGGSLIKNLQSGPLSIYSILVRLLIGWVILAVIAWIASRCVNINRFSLHALYRNRLIRGYLGASRQERRPDYFTGFDIKDNVCVHELWPPKAGDGTNALFPVINIALNVVSTKRLAWQERKAEPFTVSPLHCGSAYLGFRKSGEYGDYPGKGGLSLGTAMAISGAAVSPNMGYHSSPSIALLLTLFNVRLGWWLGNPGQAGNQSYQTDGPSFAAKPLIAEAFGQTTDERPYVYLSDGGHFENLGLYEMVRRRCRFIVVIDAGCDPDFAFEDLGNAVRKIYIDLGIRIVFNDLLAIRNRPSNTISDPSEKIPYHAIGTINYSEADGSEAGCDKGHILYIKPAYHGTEGAGVRSYATAHPTFPHESTADQWFTESQFESYRSLGLDIADDILSSEILLRTENNNLALQEVLAALNVSARS